MLINHKTNYNLKEINSNSYISFDKYNNSNRLLTETKDLQSSSRTQNKNIKLILSQNNTERKRNNLITPSKTNYIPNLVPNSFRNKKSSKIFLKYNNTENEKLYDFMDAKLIFSRVDKNKNIIPKILKSTKESKIYKQRYNKDIIGKINNYYYGKSPKSKK